MKKLLIALIVLSSLPVFGQKKIKNFVESNLSSIKSIDLNSVNDSDLEAIGTAIGDSRIVMLGEQDHGDAPTFLAKTRLIKYLHERKGFKVLAFESDFYSLNKGWEELDKKSDLVGSFLKYNIYSVWTSCKQCDDLFYTYLPKQAAADQSLKVTGFDSQFNGYYSRKNLKTFLDSHLRAQKVTFVDSDEYSNDFLPFADSVLQSVNLVKQKAFGRATLQILSQLKDSTAFEALVLKNLLTGSRVTVSRLSKIGDYLAMRDQQMAENLQWLATYKYPKEKIIVWAHNGHILKNPNQIKGFVELKNPMGHVFVSDSTFAKSTYIIGFNSKYGKAGRINLEKKFQVQIPPKDSFEAWIPDDTKLAFIDFKWFRRENPGSNAYFKLKGIGHSETTAVWTNIFDGVFYIRDMYPCDKSGAQQ